MRDVLRKKDNDQMPDFSVSYPYPYSNSSRRELPQRAQRGKRRVRKERENRFCCKLERDGTEC